MNFNENTHTFQTSTIEINVRGTIQDFFIGLHLFLPRKINMNEKKLLAEIYNEKCLHLFSIQNYSGHLTQFFNIIIRVLSMSAAMENPRRLSIFGCVLKYVVVEGVFQNR